MITIYRFFLKKKVFSFIKFLPLFINQYIFLSNDVILSRMISTTFIFRLFKETVVLKNIELIQVK